MSARNATHNPALCVCGLCKQEYDAAKRASDLINLYRAHMPWDELKQKWLAIKLADGSSDGVLYDSKRDAVRHQSDERLCAYVSYRNLVGGASASEMVRFLRFNRMAYDAGFRLPDPDDVHGGPDVLPTAARMDTYHGFQMPVPRVRLPE